MPYNFYSDWADYEPDLVLLIGWSTPLYFLGLLLGLILSLGPDSQAILAGWYRLR